MPDIIAALYQFVLFCYVWSRITTADFAGARAWCGAPPVNCHAEFFFRGRRLPIEIIRQFL
jgi:hypothetical protein